MEATKAVVVAASITDEAIRGIKELLALGYDVYVVKDHIGDVEEGFGEWTAALPLGGRRLLEVDRLLPLSSSKDSVLDCGSQVVPSSSIQDSVPDLGSEGLPSSTTKDSALPANTTMNPTYTGYDIQAKCYLVDTLDSALDLVVDCWVLCLVDSVDVLVQVSISSMYIEDWSTVSDLVVSKRRLDLDRSSWLGGYVSPFQVGKQGRAAQVVYIDEPVAEGYLVEPATTLTAQALIETQPMVLPGDLGFFDLIVEWENDHV